MIMLLNFEDVTEFDGLSLENDFEPVRGFIPPVFVIIVLLLLFKLFELWLRFMMRPKLLTFVLEFELLIPMLPNSLGNPLPSNEFSLKLPLFNSS